MTAVHIILLGLGAGVALGLIILAGAAGFVPFARARRAALAALIGGTIGFTMTALLLGPFFHDAKDLAAMAEPMGIALMVATAAAGLCAALILKVARS